jgi:hypothetical protein
MRGFRLNLAPNCTPSRSKATRYTHRQSRCVMTCYVQRRPKCATTCYAHALLLVRNSFTFSFLACSHLTRMFILSCATSLPGATRRAARTSNPRAPRRATGTGTPCAYNVLHAQATHARMMCYAHRQRTHVRCATHIGNPRARHDALRE